MIVNLSKTMKGVVCSMSIKEVKLNYIIDVATGMMLNTSISEVTIKDIAKQAGIGEATMYRYFSKKENILLGVAMKLMNTVLIDYSSYDSKSSGYEKVKSFYNNYLRIFNHHPEFFKFISELDGYMIENKLDSIEIYENGVDKFKKIFDGLYKEGVEDGSIREIENLDLFYFSSTHALIELCKKKAVVNDVLLQDKVSNRSGEISCLINIILNYLKRF